MKLSNQEKSWILQAIQEYDAAFGPVDRIPPVEGFAEWSKNIRFALNAINKGCSPARIEQLLAVETAVVWACNNSPNIPEEASDLLAALQALMSDNQFTEY